MKVKQIKPPVVLPIPQPDFTPQQGRPWFRSRKICFTMQDWQAFGDALRIACPYARFMRDEVGKEDVGEQPPSIALQSHIHDAAQDAKRVYGYSRMGMYLDPAWRLEYKRDDRGHWTWKHSCPEPKAYMDCNTHVYKGPDGAPDYIVSGQFVLALQPGNANHVAFARAFLSLFGKFASNRHQCSVGFPDYRSYDKKEAGEFWLGHHAIRWLLEDSRRMIDFIDFRKHRGSPPDAPVEGCGYRPIEDIWRAKLGL
ncbi:MAG: hypothetical protein ACK4Z4_03880 [Ferrovibrio sp.]